jgi:hypothetical protein
MPTYKIPSLLFQKGHCGWREWNGSPHLTFFADVEQLHEQLHLGLVKANNGFELFGSIFVPVLSSYVLGVHTPPLEELMVESISLEYKTVNIQYKYRKRERVEFPPETYALVIDTDLPVTQHFCDNMCAYCTGQWSELVETAWLDSFFDDLQVEPAYLTDNPYYGYTKLVCDGKRKLTPSMPWPANGYKSDGRGNVGLSGSYYKWPAYMSVAFFFCKGLDLLRTNIIKFRAEQFCSRYPREQGGFHAVTGYRYLDMEVFQYWRDWDEEKITQWHHKNWIQIQKKPYVWDKSADCLPLTAQKKKRQTYPYSEPNSVPLMLPPPKSNQPSGVCVPKFKVEIEELSQDLSQGAKCLPIKSEDKTYLYHNSDGHASFFVG